MILKAGKSLTINIASYSLHLIKWNGKVTIFNVTGKVKGFCYSFDSK